MTNTRLVAEGISKHFGSRAVLTGVDLEVHSGECKAVVGPNGIGKTTLMLILAGIVSPTHGSCRLFADTEEIRGESWRKVVSFVPDDTASLEYLTVAELLTLAAVLRGRTLAKAAAAEILALWGMKDEEDSLVGTLSLGGRRKVWLSVGLMGRTPILLLDEPTNGLDYESGRMFVNVLFKRRQQGTGILLSSHSSALLTELGAEAVWIRGGKISTARGAEAPPIEEEVPAPSEGARIEEYTRLEALLA